MILRVISKMILPYIMMFGLYVITHGEIGPGGGFQGGVILGSAFILYLLIFGHDAARRLIPPRVLDFFVVLGLLIYAGVGVVGTLAGSRYLDYSVLGSSSHDAEALGVTLVEYGVGVTVAAVMCTIFSKVAGSTRSDEEN